MSDDAADDLVVRGTGRSSIALRGRTHGRCPSTRPEGLAQDWRGWCARCDRERAARRNTGPGDWLTDARGCGARRHSKIHGACIWSKGVWSYDVVRVNGWINIFAAMQFSAVTATQHRAQPSPAELPHAPGTRGPHHARARFTRSHERSLQSNTFVQTVDSHNIPVREYARAFFTSRVEPVPQETGRAARVPASRAQPAVGKPILRYMVGTDGTALAEASQRGSSIGGRCTFLFVEIRSSGMWWRRGCKRGSAGSLGIRASGFRAQHASISPIASGKRLHGDSEIRLAEVRPHDVGEVQLGVG